MLAGSRSRSRIYLYFFRKLNACDNTIGTSGCIWRLASQQRFEQDKYIRSHGRAWTYLETGSLRERGCKLRYIDNRVVGIADLIDVQLRVIHVLDECLEQVHGAAVVQEVSEDEQGRRSPRRGLVPGPEPHVQGLDEPSVPLLALAVTGCCTTAYVGRHWRLPRLRGGRKPSVG